MKMYIVPLLNFIGLRTEDTLKKCGYYRNQKCGQISQDN